VFTIDELADLLGLKPRTIHFWKQSGLFRGPGAGPGARYTDEHLGALFLIEQLRSGGTPIAEIKTEVEGQSPADLRRLAERAKATPRRPAPTARELIAGWLAPSRGDTRRQGTPASGGPGAPGVRASETARNDSPRVSRTSPSGAWQRYPLTDGVELHVRQPSTPASRKLVRELIAYAQRISKE
jgi:DNA-binding transcriptional MerR regulator